MDKTDTERRAEELRKLRELVARLIALIAAGKVL